MQLELRGTQSKQYLIHSGSEALYNGWLYWYLSYYVRQALQRYEIRRDLSNFQQRHFRYPKLHLKRREKLKKVKTYVETQNVFPLFLHALWTHCLPSLPRIENLPAKEGGKEEKSETKVHCHSSPVTRVSHSPLCEIRSAWGGGSSPYFSFCPVLSRELVHRLK